MLNIWSIVGIFNPKNWISYLVSFLFSSVMLIILLVLVNGGSNTKMFKAYAGHNVVAVANKINNVSKWSGLTKDMPSGTLMDIVKALPTSVSSVLRYVYVNAMPMLFTVGLIIICYYGYKFFRVVPAAP